MFGDYQLGAAVVGLLSVALLVLWDSWKPLKTSLFPAPVAVVLFGIGGGLWFEHLGDPWVIKPSHLVPVAGDLAELFGLFAQPDFSQWMNPAVYAAGMTLALVASLETLLNLKAVDRLDPHQRTSPPNQELCAHKAWNVVCGLIGGLPNLLDHPEGPSGITPPKSSSRLRVAGSESAFASASFNFATISFGVPLGANSAFQALTLKSDKPASVEVATSGSAGERFTVAMA